MLTKMWSYLNAFVTRVDAQGLGPGKGNMARTAGMAGHMGEQVLLLFVLLNFELLKCRFKSFTSQTIFELKIVPREIFLSL